MLPCGLVLALSEFPLEYLREFLCAFAPSLQGACAYPTLPQNPPSFSKINLTFYTCFFFGFVCLSLPCACVFHLLLLLATLRAVCLYRACCTYIPCLQILRLLQILQPACLVGLCYFVLPWPYLGPVWGLSPFLEVLCIAHLFLELPFSRPFGSAVFLRSATSLPLLICLYWLGALCVLCVLRVLRSCVSLTYQPRAPAFAAALVCHWWFSAGLFRAPAILVLALVLFLQLPAPVVRVVLLGLLLAPVSELN